jgi:hypothetical protein
MFTVIRVRGFARIAVIPLMKLIGNFKPNFIVNGLPAGKQHRKVGGQFDFIYILV